MEDKTRSQQTPLWYWGYQWRIYVLRCKPDLLQSTGSLALCVLGKWVALCSRSACVADTDPFLAEWAAQQQCGRQLHETWLGTRKALGRRQWLRRAVLQAGWRREQEQGQKPALALTLRPFCAVLVEMQSTCLRWLFASHRPGKAVSRDLLWSCGWGGHYSQTQPITFTCL